MYLLGKSEPHSATVTGPSRVTEELCLECASPVQKCYQVRFDCLPFLRIPTRCLFFPSVIPDTSFLAPALPVGHQLGLLSQNGLGGLTLHSVLFIELQHPREQWGLTHSHLLLWEDPPHGGLKGKLAMTLKKRWLVEELILWGIYAFELEEGKVCLRESRNVIGW